MGLAALNTDSSNCGPPTEKVMATKMARVHKSKKVKHALNTMSSIDLTKTVFNSLKNLVASFSATARKHNIVFYEC